jgi:hypothetical protein
MSTNVTAVETESEPVTRRYSFGVGSSLSGKYVTVIAADADACRTAMFAKYGRAAWSTEYIPGWPGHDERIARMAEHDRIDATTRIDAGCANCGGNVRIVDGDLRHVNHHGKPLLVESHDAWVA